MTGNPGNMLTSSEGSNGVIRGNFLGSDIPVRNVYFFSASITILCINNNIRLLVCTRSILGVKCYGELSLVMVVLPLD